MIWRTKTFQLSQAVNIKITYHFAFPCRSNQTEHEQITHLIQRCQIILYSGNQIPNARTPKKKLQIKLCWDIYLLYSIFIDVINQLIVKRRYFNRICNCKWLNN